jgi:hypothetical protein
MSIDPSVSSAPIASIEQISFLETEAEILFSVHTVFRIVDVKQIDNHIRLDCNELNVDRDVSNYSCSIYFIGVTRTNWRNSITATLGV